MRGKITVLIVDDSLSVCEALKVNLENRHGFIVHTAQTGKAALVLARRLRPDIIVLDVMMPGMSGGQVAEALRDSPDMAHIPIIFFSGMISKAELEARGGEIGGELFLAKPVSHEELAAVIRAQLAAPNPRPGACRSTGEDV